MEHISLLLLKFSKNILTSIWWLLKQITTEDFKTYIKPIERNGLPLNILGNGPSLKNDLPIFNKNQEDFLVVNNFNHSPYFFSLKPRYYILVDPLFFNERLMTETQKKTIHNMNKITWKMDLIIPFKYYKLFMKANIGTINTNPNLTIIPFHSNPYLGFSNLKLYLYSKGLASPHCINVLIAAIFNGINLGYKTVYLYGADHSWTTQLRVNSENQLCVHDEHFYDRTQSQLKPWIDAEGNQVKTHEALFAFASMFEKYWDIDHYAKIKECLILNKTKESFIDAFKRQE